MSDRPRRRWPPILWAAVVLPLWGMLALIPAVLVGALTGAERPPVWPVIPGMLFATPLMLRVDRRVGPEVASAPISAPVTWWVWAAMAAGLGAMILASEVGNLLLSLRTAPVSPVGPKPHASVWTLGVLQALQPVCLIIVLHGVVQRALSTRFAPTAAMAMTIGIGALFGGGGELIQIALLLVLPCWLFRHTQSLMPSVGAVIPQAVLPLIIAAGAAPGIPGFDDLSAPWQPIWFNLMGAIALACGMAPLLSAFSPDPPPEP